ncbi:MAG: 50S ribosomal protein L4 [Spirochaetota bacterium]|nr:50S ribosomal protein L4 [Spirochaetota bacterium]
MIRMDVDKYSIDGEVIGSVELSESVFKAKVNDVLIYELIRALNTNRRQGTHSTKERRDVRGGGAKPWRQKGTGRARHGSIRSPQWRGGGVVFGPKPRSYRVQLPKKMKREAYRSIFSLKATEGSIKVVEDFKIESGKTKEIARIGTNLQIGRGVLVTHDEDPMLKRAIRNIPWFVYNNAKRISSRDILYSQTVLFTESAVKIINDEFAK